MSKEVDPISDEDTQYELLLMVKSMLKEADKLPFGEMVNEQKKILEIVNISRKVEQQENKPVEEDKISLKVISARVKDHTLVAEVEIEEDKISDEDLYSEEDMISFADAMAVNFGDSNSEKRKAGITFYLKNYFTKACLQKGSEDKIAKAIEFVNDKITEYQKEINTGWRGPGLDLLNIQKSAWKEMKTFLQSL